MKNTIKRFSVSLATSALMLNMISPVFADTEIITQGNGSDTTNTTVVTTTGSKLVTQSNSTEIDNDFEVDADTGDNSAEDNTGGDVSIDTGNSNIIVDVANLANMNIADIANCGTCAGDTEVLVKGNGTDSDNTVVLTEETSVWAMQDNHADIDNDIDVDGKTGDNDADDNTGGDVSIDTGNVGVDIDVATMVNKNLALIGGDDNDGQSVSVQVLNNGSDTDNTVVLGLETETGITQFNNADIDNDVDIDAETGDNDADDNTGGESEIDTGNVLALVDIANSLNFNSANVACDDCLLDVLAKVSGNGTESDNVITASLTGGAFVMQDNACGFHDFGPMSWWWFDDDCVDNDVDIDAETGDNDVDDSTNDPGEDPMIDTGDAGVSIEVSNQGGLNVYGAELPEVDFDFDMDTMFAVIFAMMH